MTRWSIVVSEDTGTAPFGAIWPERVGKGATYRVSSSVRSAKRSFGRPLTPFGNATNTSRLRKPKPLLTKQ